MGKIQEAKAKNDIKENKKVTMKDYIKSMENEIAKALPKVITPERFTRITLSALSNTPELQNTTPQSFLGAMMQSAQLGLEPNTPLGQAYLIPFKNNKKGVSETQFQLGYKGLIDLAYRSGEIKTIQAQTVYENDEFVFEYGLEPKLKHVPAKEKRGTPVFFYAVFKTKNGGEGFEVMSVEDVRNHAKKYSQAYNSSYSPWTTNFEEMAKKTVLKKCLKYAPLKSEFLKAVETDETIKTKLDKDMVDVEGEYIDIKAETVDTETGEVLQNEEYPDFLREE